MGGAEASSETASANAGAAGEPGFEQSGSSTGADSSLPDMRDALPTFDDAYGAESSETTASASSAAGNGTDANPADGNSETAGRSGSNGTSASEGGGSDSDNGNLGTRAEGGLEGFGDGQGTLTAAEQVAILDRQLEQSTSEFDGLILAEQNKQRELERERASQQSQTSAAAASAAGGGGSDGGYGSESGMGGAASGGGIAGGSIGGGRGMPPENPAIYAPPEDIPEGRDDDVVARQLREAAMREPDPEIREKLWVEYRKYKGIEAPQ